MTSSRQRSRRSFFRQGAALAVSGLAMPVVIPSGVLARAGQPGANDKIGIAGIGIGRQGSGVLAGAVKRPDVRFIGIADVNLPRAIATAAGHGGEGVQDFRRILERKDVDAIITATPEHWRASICILACQAGKDLYAEKPMSLTVREGRLMVQAARKYERVFQVGSQQRSMEINRIGCALVRDGQLGKLTKITAMNYPTPFFCGLPAQPVPDGLDWDMWCGPTEVVPYHAELYIPRGKPGWLSFKPYSGGEMTGWGAHGFDQVQWALGMDESGPVEIRVAGEPCRPPTYTEPETADRGNKLTSTPIVTFVYANGVTVEMSGGPGFGAIFHGENGTLTIDRGSLKSDPPELAQDAIKDVKNAETHIANWVECIKSRQRPNADVEIGHRSATVCHLGNIARWTGRNLKWDPSQETFPDDSDACQHLDRERRKPWTLPDKV